jgi:hypothetical protein
MNQSWIGWTIFRLIVVLPVRLLWELIKRDWKEEDEKKRQEQTPRPDPENKV